jgi:hypothetical protein
MAGATLFPADEADLYVRMYILWCVELFSRVNYILSVLDSYDGLGLLYIYRFPVEV